MPADGGHGGASGEQFAKDVIFFGLSGGKISAGSLGRVGTTAVAPALSVNCTLNA
ncbi:MAG: hypothetical protein HND44_12660 [Chloroflexi bacterium]|nr:hypothetical protein [Ardenticatenaceae bacterium]NOG35409.1 hypothetical protein [Chloroflexota bacterium]